MRVSVRKATAADATALARLRGQATTGETEAFRESFAAWIRDHPTHLPFLAEVGGAAVGMAWLLVAERVPAPAQPLRRSGDIQSVFVVPELRDRGIGAALLRAVLAEARELRLEHVTVHSNDRALRVYQRAGFEHDQSWLRWSGP